MMTFRCYWTVYFSHVVWSDVKKNVSSGCCCVYDTDCMCKSIRASACWYRKQDIRTLTVQQFELHAVVLPPVIVMS